jgi:hypothetical protein
LIRSVNSLTVRMRRSAKSAASNFELDSFITAFRGGEC